MVFAGEGDQLPSGLTEFKPSTPDSNEEIPPPDRQPSRTNRPITRFRRRTRDLPTLRDGAFCFIRAMGAFLLHQTGNKIRLLEPVTARIIWAEIGTMPQQDRNMPSTAVTEPTSLGHGITRRRQLRRDYLELTAMSDPELQDMNRSDIFNVVEGTYRSAARSPIVRQRQMPKRLLRGRPSA